MRFASPRFALYIGVFAALAASLGKDTGKPQIYSLAWRPDGGMLALGGYHDARLVDASTQQPVATLTGHADAVRVLAFSRDGKLLAAAGGLPARKGEVKIWDVGPRSVTRTISGHSDCIYAVAFSPHGKLLATGQL